jgi:hypothetical protein
MSAVIDGGYRLYDVKGEIVYRGVYKISIENARGCCVIQAILDELQSKLREYDAVEVSGGYDIDYPDNYVSLTVLRNDIFYISDDSAEEVYIKGLKKYLKNPELETKKDDIKLILKEYNKITNNK